MDMATYRQTVADAVSRSTDSHASDEQTAALERALTVAQSLGDRASEAILRFRLGGAYRNLGDTDRSVDHLASALSAFEAMGDSQGLWGVLNELGMAYYCQNEMSSAVGCYERGIEAARRLGDREKEAISLFNIGDAYHMMGRAADAIPYYIKGLVHNRRSCNFKCAAGLGLAYLELNRKEEARRFFQQCVEICQVNFEIWTGLQPMCSTLAVSLLALGRLSESLEAYRRGLATNPSAEHLQYSIMDAKLLQRAAEPVEGLDKVLNMLEEAANLQS
jgi:tetratricopeptide (TPR) repeat protein